MSDRGNPHRAQAGVDALRVTVATLLVIHGVARAALGIVDDFGGFLASVGLPFGVAVAWAITLTEIVGGITLAAGRLVRPLALVFAAELLVGMALVHAPAGWFVVGAGRNGVEYSVLLVAVLGVVAWVDRSRPVRDTQRG